MFVSEREFTLKQIKDMQVGDVKEIKIKKGGTIKVARSYICAFFSKKSLCTVTNKTTDGNLILQVLKRDDVITKKNLPHEFRGATWYWDVVQPDPVVENPEEKGL